MNSRSLLRSCQRHTRNVKLSDVKALSSMNENPFLQSHSRITAIRLFHSTQRQDSAILLGGLGVAAAAMGANYILKAYQAYKSRPKNESSSWKYRNFYEGPFEDKMTRREAALILGVRESASPERIRTAHRRLLVLNHPDTGGSTLLASKINEAKQMLLSGSK